MQEVGVNGDEIPTQRYISLISDVSNQHNLAEMSSQALKVVKDDAEALLDKTVGVTLDTEAADLFAISSHTRLQPKSSKYLRIFLIF